MAAYRNQVSVAGVGFDIACGNAAVRTDLRLGELVGGPGGRAGGAVGPGGPASGATGPAGPPGGAIGPAGRRDGELRRRLADIADELQHALSFGVGGVNRSRDAPRDHPLFEDPAWDAVPAQHRGKLRNKARAQLGTVGSGNHYVDVFADERNRIWVGVHFGSRGFGHTVASSFLAIGQGARWGQRVPAAEVIFDLDAPAGPRLLGADEAGGAIRLRGAGVGGAEGGGDRRRARGRTRSQPPQLRVGGGALRAHLRGGPQGGDAGVPGTEGFRGRVNGRRRGDPGGAGAATADPDTAALQARALYSTVHGAGRVMSRTAAAGQSGTAARGRCLKRGKGEPRDDAAVGGGAGGGAAGWGVDESPHVYRRLTDMLAAQGDTVKVLHTLRPLVVVMAGGGGSYCRSMA